MRLLFCVPALKQREARRTEHGRKLTPVAAAEAGGVLRGVEGGRVPHHAGVGMESTVLGSASRHRWVDFPNQTGNHI